ncbi:CAMK family protein kinase [Tolypocladium paradoxum]|uniref:CAMK family protein kinase n=1 Tax=Tolypocladium paradoxum TaxID=94208 RepID=A0A2S4KNV7_9HYPO|nr:CAMK family protein kinase [Tolypocladium paradoxum]
MADPTLIACLYPSGDGQKSHRGIENALRTIQMNESRRFEPLRDDFSRGSSLAPDDGDDTNDADNNYDGGDGNGDDQEEAPDSGHDYSPGLRLGFDDERKSSLGILIGTSPKCDIVLPKRDSLSGIAPYHCTITFDEQGRLILKDLQNPEDQRRRKKGRRTAFMPGTAVTYNGKGGQKRCAFTWILGGHEFTADNQPIVIALHDNLKFQIVVAPHDIHSSPYQENVARFLSGPVVGVDDLSLSQLGLWSMSSTAEQSGAQTPSEMQPPSKDAILLDSGELGRGGFAVVIRVWNVSTGVEYASKEPLKKRHWEYLEREINVLKGIHNEHIVNCIPEFSTTVPMPRLVLECVPLGTLEDQHDENPISVEEAFEVLCQGLSALRYLHEREDPIVHRDIKPSNILVQSRLPTLHIKLSDFGLSRASPSYLRTYCGTPRYTAPEVFARENYDAGVDVWSLGMVVFQYAHGLPDPGSWGFDGTTWTGDVVQVLEAEARALGCPLLAFLSTAMLVRDRESRYSAHRCWNMVQRLDPSQYSCSTPTWISHTYDDGDTVIYSTPDPRRAFGASGTVTDLGQRGCSTGRSPGVTEGQRRRSGAPPPSPIVYASAVRRKSISRVSKPTALDMQYTKRRERGDYAAEEVAYFCDKFSNPLHSLYVGSSLAQGTISEWTSGTTHESGAPFQRSQVKAVADGAGESIVLLDWYNDPAWTEPPPGAPVIREDSVENRVCLLGNLMQNWDEIGTAEEQVETATEAIGSPLAQTLGGVLPLESGI